MDKHRKFWKFVEEDAEIRLYLRTTIGMWLLHSRVFLNTKASAVLTGEPDELSWEWHPNVRNMGRDSEWVEAAQRNLNALLKADELDFSDLSKETCDSLRTLGVKIPEEQDG